MFSAMLHRVSQRQDLAVDEMATAVDWLMTGRATDEEIGAFLLALREKGETIDEIAGAAAIMRKHMVCIRSRHAMLVDTCGTGGDGTDTFNISTAAAIVTAAAGVPIAKHGNRSVTSRSGSSEVLQELGVCIEAPVSVVQACLDELGIGFCFAPLLHPAMRHVAPVRKRLGVRTIFNLLGPLCNPASASVQLLGVGHSVLRTKLAGALELLGTRRAIVVCGEDGMDEVTIGGQTFATAVTPEGQHDFVWHPRDFGLRVASLDALKITGPAESARLVQNVLAREKGAARDIVILNAAAAIWAAETSPSLSDCALRAAEAIDSGAAQRLLERWRTLSQAKH